MDVILTIGGRLHVVPRYEAKFRRRARFQGLLPSGGDVPLHLRIDLPRSTFDPELRHRGLPLDGWSPCIEVQRRHHVLLSNWRAGGPWSLRSWRLNLSVSWLLGVAVGRYPFRLDPGVDVALVVRLPELALHELPRGGHPVVGPLFLASGVEAAEVGVRLLVVAELDHPAGLLHGDDPSAVLRGLVHSDRLLGLRADGVVQGDARASFVVRGLRWSVRDLGWRARQKNGLRLGRRGGRLLFSLIGLPGRLCAHRSHFDQRRRRLPRLPYR